MRTGGGDGRRERGKNLFVQSAGRSGNLLVINLMEKEDKILLASKQQFYRRLRSIYPPFALVYISLLRYICSTCFSFRAVAYAFIFPLCCLNINGFICTVAAVNLSQGCMNFFLFGENHLFAEAGFSVILAAVNSVMLKQKGGEDAVMKRITVGVCIFVLCLYVARENDYQYGPVSDPNLINVFVTELFATIGIIFATGPIKVALEVQGGETSVKEMKEGFEERSYKFNRNIGVKEQDVLPSQAPNLGLR